MAMDSKCAALRRNGRIRKISKFAKQHFHLNMQGDFWIKAIFPYRDRNRKRNWNHILNLWL